MDAAGTDLEAQAATLRGEIAGLEGAADTLRKTAGSICGAAHNIDRQADEKRDELHDVMRQLVAVGFTESVNEAKARAAAVAAEEAQ